MNGLCVQTRYSPPVSESSVPKGSSDEFMDGSTGAHEWTDYKIYSHGHAMELQHSCVPSCIVHISNEKKKEGSVHLRPYVQRGHLHSLCSSKVQGPITVRSGNHLIRSTIRYTTTIKRLELITMAAGFQHSAGLLRLVTHRTPLVLPPYKHLQYTGSALRTKS